MKLFLQFIGCVICLCIINTGCSEFLKQYPQKTGDSYSYNYGAANSHVYRRLSTASDFFGEYENNTGDIRVRLDAGKFSLSLDGKEEDFIDNPVATYGSDESVAVRGSAKTYVLSRTGGDKYVLQRKEGTMYDVEIATLGKIK